MPSFVTLVNFDGTNGDAPVGDLVEDSAGDLFGTTTGGFLIGYGTVFELVNNGGGSYTPTTLLGFNGSNGQYPTGALIEDSAGDLFGTTQFGTPPEGSTSTLVGTVFELVNIGAGIYLPSTLVQFDGTDGTSPIGGVIEDSAGDLFGTTANGGTNFDGNVFEIANTGLGYATMPATLVSFNGSNGTEPAASLLLDGAGNLFGTTATGGAGDDGEVFEIANGASEPTVLASFNGTNGSDPTAGLIADGAGDLFGTTLSGGASDHGTVFELVNNGGTYTLTTLISFNGTDGAAPQDAGLIANNAGDLFGTTGAGGTDGDGTVFEIANTATGYANTPITLATFNGIDGAFPDAGLIADSAGDLFGTTSAGGTDGDGTVFEITDSGFQVTTSNVGRTLSWTGSAGSTAFGMAANWDDITDDLNPAQTAPNATDTVEFNTTNGGISGTGTVATTDVGTSGNGALELSSGASLDTGSLAAGVLANAVGQVSVLGTGTQLTDTGSLIVGEAGFGQLSITQGGVVDATSLDEAAAAGGSGGMSVDGADSLIDVSGLATIGDQGPATLSILNGGSFQAQNLNVGVGSDTGAVTVGGTATDLHVTNNMTVGHNGVFSIGTGVTVFIDGNFAEIGAVNQGDGSLIDPSTVVNSSAHGGGGGSGVTASVSITNDSTYSAGGPFNGSYILTTPLLTGTGVLEIDPVQNPGAEGDLVLNAGSVSATQTVDFTGAGGILTLGSEAGSVAIAGFSGPIEGFVAGDTIVVTSTVAAGFTANGSVISVVDTVGGATEGTLAFASAALASVAFATSGALVDQVACFVEGTLIDTVAGPRPVETLAAGDELVTLLGGPGRVVWTGHRTIDCTRHPRPEAIWPVRIAPDAFGRGAPDRELFLSPDHAVYWMDRLVPVKLLVNGATIRQVARRMVTYYHVELARHDVVLAEGLPAESYLDTGNRGMFEDAGQPLILYPDLATGQRGRETLSCAPFADRPDDVEPVWWDLADRAEAMGWRLPKPPDLTDDPDLHVVIGVRRINPVVTDQSRYNFVLPACDAPIRLVSRTARPCDARPWVGDDRSLGVSVSRVRVRHGPEIVDLALDGPGPESGWCDVEREGVRMWRWTNGDAVLRLPGAGGRSCVLELTISGGMNYALHEVDGAPEPLAAVA